MPTIKETSQLSAVIRYRIRYHGHKDYPPSQSWDSY